ncbi:alpha/beta hydrolase [Thalassotalea nanhaiensis]|uniref:Alpha/beta hydrolase n=1 Tax=Thalassotalea nanhaiensis TaxID=3065648 RepID=A0ABY9TIJ9_9GAMM|nr:alpha/beta hydrolase [Colwelliaceae bacterium SQ345]
MFYSHGFIVEGKNPTPINPRWGMYDFPKIKNALADDDYNLIAYHRPKGTNPRVFAKKLTENANTLISKGVKPENITFIGFSRGGAITVLTSNYLASEKVNFVILAGCSTFVNNNPELDVFGNVFSVFETSDGVGSCQFLIDRSKRVTTFEEISISTGKEHGAFYTPIGEWVIPVKNWVKSKGS